MLTHGVAELQNLQDYLSQLEETSKFYCSIGSTGGFLNFRNSGKRGNAKEFTISLATILNGLYDIRNNLQEFQNYQKYDETEWRRLGISYFKDLALSSIIGVQTKPCFATFSKIISWSNDIEISDYNDDYINLDKNYLDRAIFKVQELSKTFTPNNTNSQSFKVNQKSFPDENTKVYGTNLRQFIYDVYSFLIENDIYHPINNLLQKDDKDKSISYDLVLNDEILKSIFLISDEVLSESEITIGNMVRYFDKPFEIGSIKYYLSNQWSKKENRHLNIYSFIDIFNQVYNDWKIVYSSNEFRLIATHYFQRNITPLSKPFLLLAGISGTGKTRFVREQAKATGSLSETYCLTSVRPDWHEPSDLLGYISRLGEEAKYITTDVLQFIAKAWRAIIDANLDIQVDHNGRLEVTGEKSDLEKILPYWLCLDEMNLAPVEQYFADYLSILETREWQWSDENQFSYSCDAILKPSIFNQVADKSQLRADLGLNGSQYDQAWDLFYAYGMSLPLNLIVVGTVNMDETTHGFSRKVIDRALSFDFGDFFPNDFDHFFKPVINHKALSYPLYSQADPRYLPTIDSDGQKSITFLKSINAILDNTPFKLAFRALNELLLSVISASPNNDIELQAVWDDFLMCKVLPRIDGDHDKLIFIDSNSLDDISSPSYNTTD